MSKYTWTNIPTEGQNDEPTRVYIVQRNGERAAVFGLLNEAVTFMNSMILKSQGNYTLSVATLYKNASTAEMWYLRKSQ